MNTTHTAEHPLPVPDNALTDLYAAAALTAAGLTMAWIDHRNGRAVFVFLPDARLAGTVQDYYRGALSVDARGYANAIHALKAAIHAPAVVA